MSHPRTLAAKIYCIEFKGIFALWPWHRCCVVLFSAYHACELSYVHGYPQSLIAHYQLGLVIDPATGRSLPIGDLNSNGISGSAGDTEDIWISAVWDEADAAVSETAMTLWSNFAKTGDPGIPGVLEWTPYTSENDLYLELGVNPEMKVGQSQLTFPVY
jgi:para-nitrobenzyl esterase